jgi:predicted NACHT family NTPase
MDEINDSTWFEFELDSKTEGKPIKPGEEPTEKTQPILEAICEYAQEKILIVGGPGVGKSTLLAKLMITTAKKCLEDPKNPIPIMLELKLYGSSGMWGLIQSALENHNLYLEIPEIKKLLADQQLLLLADGFNELPTESARAEFKHFCRRKMQIVVTTRSFVGGAEIDRQLHLQPLNFQKVAAFFRSRLPGKDQRQIEE